MVRLQYLNNYCLCLISALQIETMAKVLAATLAFLAIHQDEQDREVISILAGREPVRKHQGRLTLAIFSGRLLKTRPTFGIFWHVS